MDDIVESLFRVLNKPAAPDPAFDPVILIHRPVGPARVFNVTFQPPLMDYVEALENAEHHGFKILPSRPEMYLPPLQTPQLWRLDGL